MEGKDENRGEQGNVGLDLQILIVLLTLGQTEDQEIEGDKDQASEQWDDSRQLQEVEGKDENRGKQGNVRLYLQILIVLLTLGQTKDQEVEGDKDQASEQWEDSTEDQSHDAKPNKSFREKIMAGIFLQKERHREDIEMSRVPQVASGIRWVAVPVQANNPVNK